MQEFHSSINLWPSTERPNLITLEGGSPLVWTMLHPTAKFSRCLTYSWKGHLDNFVPWESAHTNGVERPPLISYARWNIRRSKDLQQPSEGVDKTVGSFYGCHESVATPTQQCWQDLQQQEKPQLFAQLNTSPSSPRGISQHQVASKSKNRVPKSTLDFTASVDMSSSHQFHSMHNQSAKAAATGHHLGAQQSGSSGFTVPPLFPLTEGYQSWNHHRVFSQEPSVKSQKSCYRRTTAIIQRLWDTAWDLTTHRNVKITAF